MFKNFKLLIVTVALFTLWVVPGSAFQLFGGDAGAQPEVANPLTQLESSPSKSSGPALDLGDGGAIESGKNDSMNIWIPGLGVVGQMPKLDFGLEMLYGAQDTPKETPDTSQELQEFESDFAIKGTIKRKF